MEITSFNISYKELKGFLLSTKLRLFQCDLVRYIDMF